MFSLVNLFNDLYTAEENLLPQDGTVNYFGQIMTDEQAALYYNKLLHEIEWKNDQAIIYGKLIETKRKIAWYGDFPFTYTYSKITKIALPWITTLLELKKLVEHKTGETYNSCLVNLYHDGSEGMAWHSDDEKQLKQHATIASLSFGAERKFAFKHKATKKVIALQLVSGSLLVMKDETQDYWLHRLPPTKKVHTPRINLTFRTID